LNRLFSFSRDFPDMPFKGLIGAPLFVPFYEAYQDFVVNRRTPIQSGPLVNLHEIPCVPALECCTLNRPVFIYCAGIAILFIENTSPSGPFPNLDHFHFRDALKEHPYSELFTDNFGGEFGHCTPKGNSILAENIAEVILKACPEIR